MSGCAVRGLNVNQETKVEQIQGEQERYLRKTMVNRFVYLPDDEWSVIHSL